MALSRFAACWITEEFFSPFLKRSLRLAAAGGQEEDVPSRAAREGSSEGIHPRCLQRQNHFRPSYHIIARVASSESRVAVAVQNSTHFVIGYRDQLRSTQNAE